MDLKNENLENITNSNISLKKKKGKNNALKKGKSTNGHSKYYRELICEKCGEKPTQYGLLSNYSFIIIYYYYYYYCYYI